jgi:hypothetical protein
MWNRLRQRYPGAYVAARDGPFGRHDRVRLEPFAQQAEARRYARALRGRGQAVFVDAVVGRALLARSWRLAGRSALMRHGSLAA